MNKAILVIDMPNCCDKCFALDDNGDYPKCIITGETKGYTFRTREQKMDKCPLKPMPEKTDVPDWDDTIKAKNICFITAKAEGCELERQRAFFFEKQGGKSSVRMSGRTFFFEKQGGLE